MRDPGGQRNALRQVPENSPQPARRAVGPHFLAPHRWKKSGQSHRGRWPARVRNPVAVREPGPSPPPWQMQLVNENPACRKALEEAWDFQGALSQGGSPRFHPHALQYQALGEAGCTRPALERERRRTHPSLGEASENPACLQKPYEITAPQERVLWWSQAAAN